MLWRLNFLVVLLCMAMGNTYILYYICPLHTFYFFVVYAIMSPARCARVRVGDSQLTSFYRSYLFLSSWQHWLATSSGGFRGTVASPPLVSFFGREAPPGSRVRGGGRRGSRVGALR